jgi:hypothetical protein
LAHHPAVAEDAFGVPVIEPSQAAQAILAAVAERRQGCIRPQNNQKLYISGGLIDLNFISGALRNILSPLFFFFWISLAS